MSERQVVRTWNVLGTEIPVVRTKLDKGDEGEYKKGEILVSRKVPPHLFWRTEGHELGHAAADAVGFSITLQDVFGLSADVASRIEEEWTAKVLPVILAALQQAKALVPPPAPSDDGGDA